MPTLDHRVMDHLTDSSFRSLDGLQEAVVRRASYLGDKDRMLIQLVLRGSVSRREMARLVGAEAGTVSRRIARLSRRLHDPIVVLLTDGRCPLPEEYRQLGIEHFLRGLSVRDLADLHHIGKPVVRQMLNYVRGWHKGITQRR